jgi:hypothetical protein
LFLNSRAQPDGAAPPTPCQAVSRVAASPEQIALSFEAAPVKAATLL